ncbi:adamts a disintegrin and metalloprotease with thrombospondin motifs protease [Holotrichia oblita]|uniref:Adamts a disintegrin and metalloprotease with thrombospondin motifs protease n=1 Tax=Holotrichia oblita TaxID=644536 RepID=A0ACB9SWX4_HOLOL|nr:adamts a disintegrin and metalloprotease with thrombospondin motifs protease [Holotrichia oblita]
MYDTPTEHSFHPADILPGVMYDGTFQCKELLGPNSALCMTGIECDNLICYVEDKGCVETHTGVAPGTSCGEKMWCIRGECIEIGERLQTVDGGWGSWSDWSECTRTCGSGVAIQERHCENPRPKNGGKYCEGDHMRHKICATEVKCFICKY